MVSLERRELLKSVTAFGLMLAFCKYSLATSDTVPTVSNNVEEFIKLCELVTGTTKLERETAQQILNCIQNEPWGKEHLGQIARKLLPAYATETLPTDRLVLLDPKRFEEGERWFIGHLLTTWFTGVYYHQTSRVISYEHALMFAALDDIRPSPSYCAGEFGYWSKPPESRQL